MTTIASIEVRTARGTHIVSAENTVTRYVSDDRYSRRNAALWNFRKAHFDNLGFRVNIGFFGDSMIGTSIDNGLQQTIGNVFGIAGFGFLEAAPSSGASTVYDACVDWLTGQTCLVPAGGIATIGLAGGNFPVKADTLRIYYLAKPGGGTFKVQSSRNGGAWVDEVGFTNVSAANATTVGRVISIVKGVDDRAAQYRVRVVGLTGAVTVVGGGLFHSQVRGAVISRMYNQSSNINNTNNAKQTSMEIIGPILASLAWNLAFFSNLDGAVSAREDLPNLLSNVFSGIVYGGTGPLPRINPDPSFVLIGPPCGYDFIQDEKNRAQAAAMEDVAYLNGYAFFDNRTWALPVENALTQGLVPAGDVHYAPKAAMFWPSLMVSELGLAYSAKLGVTESPDLTFYRGGVIRGNTVTGSSSYSPTIEVEGTLRVCVPPGGAVSGGGLLLEDSAGPTDINDCASIALSGDVLRIKPKNAYTSLNLDPGIGGGFNLWDNFSTASAPQGSLGTLTAPIRQICLGKVAAGAAGDVTAHASHGTVIFAAGSMNPIVVTNAYVSASSNILLQVYGADATLTSARVLSRAAGSFTIAPNAAATAATTVAWFLLP